MNLFLSGSVSVISYIVGFIMFLEDYYYIMFSDFTMFWYIYVADSIIFVFVLVLW